MQATLEAGAEVESATIFVIDDEPGRLGLTNRRLKHLHMKKEVVESISAARGKLPIVVRQAIQVGKPVIVLLDLMFPSDTNEGINFLREIRTGGAGVPRDIPVIIHTAASEPALKKIAITIGVEDYITKSLDPEILDNAIQKAAGLEFLEASVLCEVVEVDVLKDIVRIRINGNDGWIAERELDISMCPVEARICGGAFFLETYTRRTNTARELVVRSRGVDPAEEEGELRYLLGDEDEELGTC